jgi:hypothetical protein
VKIIHEEHEEHKAKFWGHEEKLLKYQRKKDLLSSMEINHTNVFGAW